MVLPNLGWLDELKRNTDYMISHSPLIEGCVRGDPNYIKAFWAIYWENVDDIPAIYNERFLNIPDKIIQRRAKKFSGIIIADEKNHRQRWIEGAKSTGISYERLNSFRGRFPLVTAISNHLREQVSPAKIFLRTGGVEIVAGRLSSILLHAEKFYYALEEIGRTWFKLHIVHSGTTHEQIMLRLALRELEKEGVNVTQTAIHEITIVVTKYVNASLVGPRVAEEFAKAA